MQSAHLWNVLYSITSHCIWNPIATSTMKAAPRINTNVVVEFKTISTWSCPLFYMLTNILNRHTRPYDISASDFAHKSLDKTYHQRHSYIHIRFHGGQRVRIDVQRHTTSNMAVHSRTQLIMDTE